MLKNDGTTVIFVKLWKRFGEEPQGSRSVSVATTSQRPPHHILIKYL